MLNNVYLMFCSFLCNFVGHSTAQQFFIDCITAFSSVTCSGSPSRNEPFMQVWLTVQVFFFYDSSHLRPEKVKWEIWESLLILPPVSQHPSNTW